MADTSGIQPIRGRYVKLGNAILVRTPGSSVPNTLDEYKAYEVKRKTSRIKDERLRKQTAQAIVENIDAEVR